MLAFWTGMVRPRIVYTDLNDLWLFANGMKLASARLLDQLPT